MCYINYPPTFYPYEYSPPERTKHSIYPYKTYEIRIDEKKENLKFLKIGNVIYNIREIKRIYKDSETLTGCDKKYYIVIDLKEDKHSKFYWDTEKEMLEAWDQIWERLSNI